MNLNVGCGNFPMFGDYVNVDLHVKGTMHRHFRELDVGKTPFFVRCDAENLPFQDKVFESSFSSHVLEHVNNPYKMLAELIRVTRNQIKLLVPNWLSGYEPEHKNYFSKKWILKTFQRMNVYHVAVKYCFKPLRKFFPFAIPLEMDVTVIV